jgi:thiamine kinase-like enzyme
VSLTLEQALARVPGWDGPDVRVTPLGGGITNHNFRIDRGGESFVLRLVGENTDLLGIDREVEYAASQAAAAAGVAPEVVHFIRPEGCLVTRFVAGRTIGEDEIGQPAVIRRVAQALRTIHGLPPIPGTFSAFAVVRDYAEQARRLDVRFPRDFDLLRARLAEIESSLPSFDPCPCHNDLLNANFLEAGGRLYVLDWEYAGMGDPYFDLGNFSRNHGFSEDQDRTLLEAYVGRATPGRLARLRLMRIASDMREAMWGLLQSGISHLDFNFRDYADRHFQRAAEGIGDPHWSEWLKEASHGV